MKNSYIEKSYVVGTHWNRLIEAIPMCTYKIRGVIRKFAENSCHLLHRLINRAGITAHNTATHMQLIAYNMLGVSRLCALQRSSRQRYIARTGPFYVAF